MPNQIDTEEKFVLAPLAYFDIFNYPLTLMEIWRYALGKSMGLNQVSGILEQLKSKQIIESREGFFCLKNRGEIIKRRRDNFLLAERKFKKAQKFTKYLRWVPGVRAVAICNTLAYSNAPDDSDIDFFIITDPGKIWSARFWSVALTRFFGGRPAPGKVRDTICLSFFTTADNLNLEQIILPSLRQKEYSDIYLIYWINQIVPIYEEDGEFAKFFEANNWTRKYLPNIINYNAVPRRHVKTANLFIKKIIGFILANPFLENIYKKYQKKILPEKLKELSEARDTRVVVSDQMLKFHVDDRREKFAKKFEEKLLLYV